MKHAPSRWPTRHADPAAAALAELATAVAETAPVGDWPTQAACRDDATDRHWPTGREGSPRYERQAAAALDMCRFCPVRAQCLAYALEAGEDDGIWGGTTPAQRRSRLDRDRTAATTRSHIAS
ncbi:WhiB family transcriptional regulator [Pseudonocardia sp. Ae505_Ps2]|uniref:WhiB family transcriptional regulator n=1 Tax=Pseudonocardia sp. Ae505_Ps2 TaxID=1885034 RepID=UPI0009FE8E82|nr:WhiB family transcriptional regulator [Pseudonocardia sp. Ae505_Ps2]